MERHSALLIQIQTPDGHWVDVGLLHRRNEKSWFEFEDSYWSLPRRPVLGQVFEEEGRVWQTHTNVALPRWFSHLLPEGMLRDAVARAAGVKVNREFELLKRLGTTDLPGAVRAVELSDRMLAGSIPQHTDVDDSDESDPLLKFSLAGAQLKFSIYGDGRGMAVPAAGQAGNYIVKFPDGRPGFAGVPEAEFAGMELARASGIRTPAVKLVKPESIAGLADWAAASKGLALAVQRFDRKGSDQRVHMEELAQVLNIPTARDRAKYKGTNFETVAIFVAALDGLEAVGEVIDRIVLNILLGNGDAHLKNWAFLYSDGRLPSLSPVYDVLPTVLYIQPDDLGLNLGVGGTKEFTAIIPGSFDALGSRTGYGVESARQRARTAVERTLSGWPMLADHLSTKHYRRLTDRLDTLKLVKP